MELPTGFNIYDGVVAAVLVWALYRGLSRGLILQFSGIVGLIAGVWVAGKFSGQAAKWFDINDERGLWFVYAGVVILVLIGVVVLLRAINKVLTVGGLSLPVRILGAAASILKYLLILALVQSLIMHFGEAFKLDAAVISTVKESLSYPYIKSVGDIIFPYIGELVSMAPATVQAAQAMVL